jgi:hypothetical protein
MIACRATTLSCCCLNIRIILCYCRMIVMHAPGVSVDGRSIDECIVICGVAGMAGTAGSQQCFLSPKRSK